MRSVWCAQAKLNYCSIERWEGIWRRILEWGRYWWWPMVSSGMFLWLINCVLRCVTISITLITLVGRLFMVRNLHWILCVIRALAGQHHSCYWREANLRKMQISHVFISVDADSDRSILFFHFFLYSQNSYFNLNPLRIAKKKPNYLIWFCVF